MDLDRRKIVKNSVITYVIMFFNIVIGLITAREVLRVLGISDFGIYSVITGFVLLFAFINGSMSGSIQRYLSASFGKSLLEDVTNYFNASIVVHVGIALIILLVGLTLGEWFVLEKLSYPVERREAVFWVYHASLYSFSLSVLSTPAQAMLSAYERIPSVAFFTFLAPLGRFIGVFVADYVGGDALIVFAFVIFWVSVVQLLLFYGYAYVKCSLCRFKWVRDKEYYSQMVSFAGWGLIGDLAVVLKGSGTSVLINLFFGTTANASNGVAMQLTSNFMNLSTMVTKAANPQIIKTYVSGDKTLAFGLVRQLSKISFVILLVIAVPFLFETEWLLILWLKNVPPYAVLFSQWAIIISLINVSAVPLQTLSRATGTIKLYQIVIGGLTLLIIPIAYLVYILDGGVASIFVVIAVMSLLTMVVRLMILKRDAGLVIWPFVKDTYLKSLFLLVFVYLLSCLVEAFDFRTFELISHICILPLVVLLVSYFYILSSSERASFIAMIRKRRSS
jgi:O-antigen/teichoic acid export membrane protein